MGQSTNTIELDRPTFVEMCLIRNNLLNPESRLRKYWHIQLLRCQHRLELINKKNSETWNTLIQQMSHQDN